MMRVSPDGRSVRIDLPQLAAELELGADVDGPVFDQHGRRIGRLQTRVKDTAELVAERAAVCRECEGGGPGAVRLTVAGHVLNRVNCRPAGCGQLSLVSGRCVLQKWPSKRGD